LKERGDDILLLVEHFIKLNNLKYNLNITDITKEAKEELLNSEFPGNIRELKNLIENLVITLREGKIDLSHLNDKMQKKNKQSTIIKIKYNRILENEEKENIITVLKECNGNISKAAVILNVHRVTLSRKIKKYGI
jgi:DNA-binding NtrC family response regulator